ncbi:uncharacterized protein K02A2.6-like [Saccostrea cucullata]|uniref:uncharacterized protein K02A2.6-like n=1 Tax=Saccostrea cuccullata TaxID=36930 RepID=UPI002ED4170B
MSPLPKRPWSEVSMDFCGPFPSGSYLMVVVDDYLRYPVVEILSKLTAKAVIPKLDNVFALFGIPDVVKTDNGPPFNGSLFKEFAKHLGFQHRKITPLWPQANGEAEVSVFFYLSLTTLQFRKALVVISKLSVYWLR